MPTAALILALLGLFSCWVPIFGWAGVASGLVGSVLGLMTTFQPNRTGRAVAGLAIGVLALILGLAVQIPIAAALSSASP